MKKEQKLPISVLVAVKNEEVNIAKCLRSLRQASSIYVLDSQSADQTALLARKAGAKVIQFHFRGGYPKKRQWALDNLKIRTPWVLLVDADEEVTPQLWDEISCAISSSSPDPAYLIWKEFHFLGRRFRFGGFSFESVFLFQKEKARFEKLLEDPSGSLDMEVHERIIVDGHIGKLRSPVIHNDFKGLESYLERHNKYSTWEARLRHQFLTTGQYGREFIRPNLFGNSQERRRFLKKIAIQVPFEPMLWFLYHYFFRLGFLEGKAGWIASRIRAQYIFQVRAKMAEFRFIENEI